MTFKQFIASQEITDDPKGDFIADFRQDREHKYRRFYSFGGLEGYLQRKGACGDAMRAAKAIWADYESRRRAQRH